MAKAVGIGGVFLKARDPQALAAWYANTLAFPRKMEGPWPSMARNPRA